MLEDGTGLLLSEAVPLLETLQELTTLYQLHHHVHVQLVCEDINQLHNVGVALTQFQDLDLTARVMSGGGKGRNVMLSQVDWPYYNS